MTRDKALEISDSLVDKGISHNIVVGVHIGYKPREQWSVNVTPGLMFSSESISTLQSLADELGCEIAFWAGSFTLAEK